MIEIYQIFKLKKIFYQINYFKSTFIILIYISQFIENNSKI